MAQAHSYFFPSLRAHTTFGKNLSHDSEMQGLVKIGVLEKIWLREMDFRVGTGDLGPKREFRAKMGL